MKCMIAYLYLPRYINPPSFRILQSELDPEESWLKHVKPRIPVPKFSTLHTSKPTEKLKS